jgi:hypothetical protein
MNMRSTHPRRHPGKRLVDNLNKQKFTTNIDQEQDKIRLRNEEIKSRKNASNIEPFWQDFNTTINDICREKENPQSSKVKQMSRTRGPSQPQMNYSVNKKM